MTLSVTSAPYQNLPPRQTSTEAKTGKDGFFDAEASTEQMPPKPTAPLPPPDLNDGARFGLAGQLAVPRLAPFVILNGGSFEQLKALFASGSSTSTSVEPGPGTGVTGVQPGPPTPTKELNGSTRDAADEPNDNVADLWDDPSPAPVPTPGSSLNGAARDSIDQLLANILDGSSRG